MANLPRFDLHKNKNDEGWDLTNSSGKKVGHFERKSDALEGGVLKDLVGAGSVRIRTEDNKFQEERTYPRSRDPKKSPG